MIRMLELCNKLMNLLMLHGLANTVVRAVNVTQKSWVVLI
jgi:hypothetical protein